MNKNISDNIVISFEKIKEVRLKIKNKIQKIHKIKSEIKKNYTHYIKNERQNFFGLDSFHFQNKLIDLEYTNLIDLYNHIDNRIYGDYYKLFIMIERYLKKNLLGCQYEKIKELGNLSKYPVYKDLERTKKYDFDMINNIHHDIISVISSVRDIYNENMAVIKEYVKQLNYGINIDNYIISHEYMNNNLNGTNNLHESYLNVYHGYHAKLLNNYYDKIKLFLHQINHNMVDDTNSSESETNNREKSPMKYVLDDDTLESEDMYECFDNDINENEVIETNDNYNDLNKESSDLNKESNDLNEDNNVNIKADLSDKFIPIKKKKRNRKKNKKDSNVS